MRLKRREIAAFLRGDRTRVGEIRASIQAVVRSFQFPDAGLEAELAQDALSRIFQNLAAGRFRGESSLKTYAQRVAKYTCLEHVRRKRFEVKMDLDAIPSRARWSEPEGALLGTEEHQRNLRAFAALPGESRELLRLIFLERLSYGEVARRLGVTEGAIKSRVHRVRITCREAAGGERAPGGRRGGRRVVE